MAERVDMAMERVVRIMSKTNDSDLIKHIEFDIWLWKPERECH
jgi:hypothetical protein